MPPRKGFVFERVALGCAVTLLAVATMPIPATAQPLTVTHLAGSVGGIGWFDGTGSAARFDWPFRIAFDGAGNLYVADTSNHTIRRIVVATGAVSTLAGTEGSYGSADGTGSAARFSSPCGIAADGAGNVYVADTDNHTIRMVVVATGAVSTLAGTAGSQGSADGTGSAARFRRPYGVASDGAGNVYVADSNSHTIRRILVATGAVSTLAGTAGSSGSADGSGSVARFYNPRGIAADGTGNLYVADFGNSTIRQVVVATGAVTTLAGTAGSTGSTDGTGSAALFYNPYGIAADGAGNVYVADTYNNTVREIVVATGAVTTLAGTAGYGNSGSVDGTGSAARFYNPSGIAADGAGNLYVADTDNHTLRKVVLSTAAVTTFAGLAGSQGTSDGSGTAARFYRPRGVAADGAGNVYVADTDNHTIRKAVVATGAVTTLAGTAGSPGGTNGTGSAARFRDPSGIAADGAGNLYVADSSNSTIRLIVAGTGAVSTLAGATGIWGSSNGTGSGARFGYPEGIAADGAGNVFVADTDNHMIRRIEAATGVVTTLAGAVFQGSVDGTGTAARFRSPRGVAADGAGNVFVADSANHTIRQIVVATGAVTTLAGTAGSPGSADGTGSVARFYHPDGIAADTAGNLYVSDTQNQTIRKVVVATKAVTTLAGSAGSWGNADGTGSVARFDRPFGITTDGAGNVFVADTYNHAIRAGAPALPDAATVDSSSGLVSVQRQLDTSPQTATSWLWEVLRIPSGSTAPLSSPSVRNPTFTPDRAGLHTFRLTATNGPATSSTTVSLDAFAAPTAAVSGGGTICASQSATIQAALTGAPPWNVTWSDSVTQPGLTTSPAARSVSPASTTAYTVTALSDGNTAGVAAGSATVTVNAAPAPATPSISAGSSVNPGTPGNVASVAASAGSTWAWGITGGTITAGQGTSQITFTAGSSGSVALSVVETVPNGCASSVGSLTIPISGSPALAFFGLSPCRLFDTRNSSGPDVAWPALFAGETRLLSITDRCGLPSTARSLSVNVTVTAPGAPGTFILYAGDLPSAPGTSNLSFRAGTTRANNGILDLASDGSQTFKIVNDAPAGAHFILDVNGYFQ